MLNFIIADSGIGIRYDFYPKLFQPFMQMDSSDTRQYGGVGLGLAVSKHLINLMGGSLHPPCIPSPPYFLLPISSIPIYNFLGAITFTSEPGKGSEFVVSIPVGLPKVFRPLFRLQNVYVSFRTR
jgi:signal transduction histidine kinase